MYVLGIFMTFKCVLCLDVFQDVSAKNSDTDKCASCGYSNEMQFQDRNSTWHQVNTE
jgi:hypothetical protein